MSSKQDKGESRVSPLSQLISGLRNKRSVSVLFSGIFILAIAALVLVIFEQLIPAIVCLAVLLILVVLVVGDLYKVFSAKDEQIEDIIRNTSDGRRYYPEFSVDIKNGEKETVATVHKTLYIRRIE